MKQARRRPTAGRPKHASPSVLAPTRPRLVLGSLAVLTAVGVAGFAAVAGAGPSTVRDLAAATTGSVSAAPALDGLAPPPAANDDDAARNAWRRAAATKHRSSASRTTGTQHDAAPASELAASGIPSTALAAYQQAAAREALRRPACGLTWPLLAGIGRVESDHGRFADAVLHTDGVSLPRIIGIPLNGHGTALITDTDDGRLDGDTTYDRAVGPMQFIPSTWAGWAVDADQDGRADPFDIFDAAAAAADYLCAAGRDLQTYAGEVQAVRSYNNSNAYIALVLRLERVYATGVLGVTLPVLPTDPDPSRIRSPHRRHLPPVDPGRPRGTEPRKQHHPGTSSSGPTRSDTPTGKPSTPTNTPTGTTDTPTGTPTSTEPTCPTPPPSTSSSGSTGPPGSPSPSCTSGASSPTDDPPDDPPGSS